MLLVIFHIGKDRYALDSRHVLEIVPLVVFRTIPQSPEYLCGLFQYRGRIVPVIDVSCLSGQGRARHFFSTRIILAQMRDYLGNSRTIGLLAERVTDTLKAENCALTRAAIKIKDAPYLGDVIADAQGIILCVEVDELLPASVQDMFFAAAPED